VRALSQFIAGKPVDMGWFQNWLTMISEATADGRCFSRVRIVSVPLTDYSRFGAAWHHAVRRDDFAAQ
jgi:hypothetical protein